MNNKDNTEIGTVVESLPNTQFRIEKADGTIVRGYISGKMKINRIKVLVGDRVLYIVDENGPNNRIIKRM